MSIEEHIRKTPQAPITGSFRGAGSSLSGKRAHNAVAETEKGKEKENAATPDVVQLPPGKLFFGYPYKEKVRDGEMEAQAEQPKVFDGEGKTLRAARKGALLIPSNR